VPRKGGTPAPTIFSFGEVSRGAVYALKTRGVRDITICIQRPDHEVREEILDCHYVRVRAGGPKHRQESETIRRAINIDQGTIQKASIRSFQDRRPDYPHNAVSVTEKLSA
jgi:hypothetical protein